MYYAYQCNKCKQNFMSQAPKKPKCTYCNSTSAFYKFKHENPKIVSEYIRRMNAYKKGFYDDEFMEAI